MQNRVNIIQKLINGVNLPHQEKVENLDRDYKSIYKFMERLGLNKDIGMSKDKDRSAIWFRRKK